MRNQLGYWADLGYWGDDGYNVGNPSPQTAYGISFSYDAYRDIWNQTISTPGEGHDESYSIPATAAQIAGLDPAKYVAGGATGLAVYYAKRDMLDKWIPAAQGVLATQVIAGYGTSGDVPEYVPTPGTLDQVKYGYFMSYKDSVLGALNEVATAAGLPGFNWSPYQLRAMFHEFKDQIANGRDPVRIWSYSQPFSDLVWLPIKLAAEDTGNAVLAEAARNLAPGSAWYIEHQGVGNAIKSARDKATFTKFVIMAALAVGAGLYSVYAGAAATGAGASGAGTASVSGAELALLVESGTVGMQGAFLEAAALTGSTVTYSTTTGAIIGAITPAGANLVFDPAVDAFAQFGVDPSQMVLEAPNPTQMPDANDIAQPPKSSTPSLTDQAQTAAKELATQAAKQQAAQLLQSMLQDDPQAPGQAYQVLEAPGGPSNMGALLALGLVAGAVVVQQSRKRTKRGRK